MDDIRQNESAQRAVVDLSVFTLDTVKDACYLISNIATSEIIQGPPGAVTVCFTAHGLSGGATDVISRFRECLLDADLRRRIAAETLPVRNLILAHALSRIPLVDTEDQTTDF